MKQTEATKHHHDSTEDNTPDGEFIKKMQRNGKKMISDELGKGA